MVDVPAEKLAELARETALLDCEMRALTPEGCHDIDEWDVLRNAELDVVEYDDDNYDMLVCHFDAEVTISECVARRTHWQPAEYKNHHCETWVTIWWDMDPNSNPEVEIEVLGP